MTTEKSASLIALHKTYHEPAPEVSLILPAHNEAESIAEVVLRVRNVMDPLQCLYEIVVVDDGSMDGTAEKARVAGARVIQHPYAMGNGAAIKSGIRNAKGNILVMLDADGQHPPEDIPRLLEKMDTHHMAVGARTADSETNFHRRLANRIYNWFASYVCKRKIEDLTSGFRAVRGHIAREFVSLLPNTFSYPTTITLATVRSGYSLTYVPVTMPKRAGNSKSKIRLFTDGSRFFLIMFKITTLFSPMRIFLPISAMTFLLGLCYGLFKIFVMDGRYGPTSAMLMTVSVLMFLVGLVSDQVTQLRFDQCSAFYQRMHSEGVNQQRVNYAFSSTVHHCESSLPPQ